MNSSSRDILDPRMVGIVGLGNMGTPMAQRLIDTFVPRGIGVLVNARSRDRATSLLEKGATWAEHPRDLARADVVIVMVPDLPQVEEVLDGADGLLPGVTEKCLVVVCSSVSPDGLRTLATRVAAQSRDRVHVIDAPVSGGVSGAESGTLSLMVGGSDSDVATAWSTLSALGRPVHLGAVGSGEVAKACNQLIVASTMVALSEAALIAEHNGLDLSKLFDTLGGGYAGSQLLETKKANLIDRDYTPTGVAQFMVKDLRFAEQAAVQTGTVAPQLRLLRTIFEDLVDKGLGHEDLAVVHAYIDGLRDESLP